MVLVTLYSSSTCWIKPMVKSYIVSQVSQNRRLISASPARTWDHDSQGLPSDNQPWPENSSTIHWLSLILPSRNLRWLVRKIGDVPWFLPWILAMAMADMAMMTPVAGGAPWGHLGHQLCDHGRGGLCGSFASGIRMDPLDLLGFEDGTSHFWMGTLWWWLTVRHGKSLINGGF